MHFALRHGVTSHDISSDLSTILIYDFFYKCLVFKHHGRTKGEGCGHLSGNLEEGQQTGILVMDFAKAFDKFSHSLPIHKLHHYGIRGEENMWINK